MNNKNKRITAGILLCTLGSTGLTNLQTAACDTDKLKKAAKESKNDIIKTGLAITGGALLIDKITDKIPNPAKEFISELGRFAIKPLKWIGRNVIDKISEMPTLLLIGGIAMFGYSIKKISEKYFENRVKEEVDKKLEKERNNNIKVKLTIDDNKNQNKNIIRNSN